MAGGARGGSASGGFDHRHQAQRCTKEETMAFTLPELPYSKDGLTPHLSTETLDFHYGKHHQAYVTNLNNLAKGTPWENKTLEEIIKGADGGIFNNAAQVW